MEQTTRATVRHFRQILLWPLELMAADGAAGAPWQVLTEGEFGPCWRTVEDEFPSDPALFQERHYSEFVTFLPYVQRFLYGEGRGRSTSSAPSSPIRVFRRTDVGRARLTFAGGEAVVLDVAHVALYFFYDLDVVILVVELAAEKLALPSVQDALYRFGRAYPTHWDRDG